MKIGTGQRPLLGEAVKEADQGLGPADAEGGDEHLALPREGSPPGRT
jgi:hypothetical protein